MDHKNICNDISKNNLRAELLCWYHSTKDIEKQNYDTYMT